MTTFNRIIILCFGIIATTVNAHYDAVVWTTNPNSANTLQRFSVDDALAAATLDHPLLLIGVDDFHLTAFNTYADVYANEPSKRPITTSMRASRGYNVIALVTDTALPADTVVVSAQTPIDIGTISKARVLLVHAADMDELDASITSVLEKFATNGYTAVLTSSDALRSSEATQVRRKRAATDAPSTPAPVKVQKLTEKCGVSVKGARIVVQERSDTFVLCSNSTTRSDMIDCDISDPNVRTFTLTLSASRSCGDVKDRAGPDAPNVPSMTKAVLLFTVARLAGIAHRDNWQVTSIIVSSFTGQGFGIVTPGSKLIDARTIELENAIERGVGCGLTLPVYKFQNRTDNVKVSFQFVEVLLSPFNFDDKMTTFGVNSTMIDDCVPMFTAGSWMGIGVGLFILAVFLFGLIMLSELSVMDRFDDPKGKPLQINIKNE